MRRIARLDIPAATQHSLNRKQAEADTRLASGRLNVNSFWKAARQTAPLKKTLSVLQKMTGDRERCMYCGDSHGTDIEHFWPKSPYPERMFRWPNLLLCCTECGRFKGEQFPLDHNQPLLVDPTSDDPWQFLDFDPATGNIVARFDAAKNDWTPKGTQTVEVLQLDRREALATSYQKTYRRLKAIVEAALRNSTIPAEALVAQLRDADDHGLLGWCFRGSGQSQSPFAELWQSHVSIWTICAHAALCSHRFKVPNWQPVTSRLQIVSLTIQAPSKSGKCRCRIRQHSQRSPARRRTHSRSAASITLLPGAESPAPWPGEWQ